MVSDPVIRPVIRTDLLIQIALAHLGLLKLLILTVLFLFKQRKQFCIQILKNNHLYR